MLLVETNAILFGERVASKQRDTCCREISGIGCSIEGVHHLPGR
jgi:hypothetical protein